MLCTCRVLHARMGHFNRYIFTEVQACYSSCRKVCITFLQHVSIIFSLSRLNEKRIVLHQATQQLDVILYFNEISSSSSLVIFNCRHETFNNSHQLLCFPTTLCIIYLKTKRPQQKEIDLLRKPFQFSNTNAERKPNNQKAGNPPTFQFQTGNSLDFQRNNIHF